MSVITIDYHCLNHMITQAKGADAEFEDYSQTIDKHFINKLSSLDGDDAAGNISTALTLARQKKDKIGGYRTNFTQLKDKLNNLKADAELADKEVKSKINSLAECYEKDRAWYQKVGSFIYGCFCDAADFISSTFLGEIFVNAVSKAWTGLKIAKEYIGDWFKYGAGKYVANIIGTVMAVIGVVLAIGAAVVNLPGTLMVVAIVAVVAGAIALVYAFGNMVVAVEENTKAMEYHKKGQLGMARYYGAQTTVQTWAHRNDFGGKTMNKIIEAGSNIYEFGGKAATLVLTVCGIVNSVHQLRAVKNSKTGEIIRFQKVFNKDGKITNVIKNNLKDKLKFKGLGSIIGKSKSIAFWNSDPTKGYEGTRNFLKLITMVTDTTLKFYGGKDTCVDDIDKMLQDPSNKNITKAIKSASKSFFMPDYIQSNFGFFVPEIAIMSDLDGVIGSMGETGRKINEVIEEYGDQNVKRIRERLRRMVLFA